MIYVASPYTGPTANIMQERFELAMKSVARFMVQDELPVFSPIVHCHELALKYDLPKDSKFWLKYNTQMLRSSEAVYVLAFTAWRSSVGVLNEIKLARELHIPVKFFDKHGFEISEDHAKTLH